MAQILHPVQNFDYKDASKFTYPGTTHRVSHLHCDNTSSQMAMPTPHGPRTARRAIVAKASFSDDEDAITPCSSPPPEPQNAVSHQQPAQSSIGFTTKRSHSSSVASSPKTSTSQSWHFDPTDGEEMDDCQLWQRMLDIQRTFHCYNSARMSAALLELEMGVDAGHLARTFYESILTRRLSCYVRC